MEENEWFDPVESLKQDEENFQRALNHLIDSVSSFKSKDSLTDIEPEEWATMLEVLNFSQFIISGLMYSYGVNICGHEHDEEEDEE